MFNDHKFKKYLPEYPFKTDRSVPVNSINDEFFMDNRDESALDFTLEKHGSIREPLNDDEKSILLDAFNTPQLSEIEDKLSKLRPQLALETLRWDKLIVKARAIIKYRKPPLGEIAGLIYEKLQTLPEHKAMTVPEISEWLVKEKRIILDDTTIRTKHLPQLEPYGLYRKKRIGYCIR
jgi:hypothetical protein